MSILYERYQQKKSEFRSAPDRTFGSQPAISIVYIWWKHEGTEELAQVKIYNIYNRNEIWQKKQNNQTSYTIDRYSVGM